LCRVAACLHRFGDVAASLCDVAEGLRSSVKIVDNLNMAIPYIAAERGFVDAVIELHQTRLLLRQCCGCCGTSRSAACSASTA
jgi:acetyl-CoA carboxylase carboxyltransferase component